MKRIFTILFVFLLCIGCTQKEPEHFTNEMLRHSKWKDARVFMVTG